MTDMTTCSYHMRGVIAAEKLRRRCERTGKTLGGQWTWTEEELSVCRELYPDRVAIRERLQRRSAEAIRKKCEELGLASRRVPWTAADITRLRKMYRSASWDELFATFPGRTEDAIRQTANKRRMFREKKPYKLTGFAAIDQIRARCLEQGFTMLDLDQYARSGQYFRQAHWRGTWRWYSDRFVARAIRALGGRISIEWDDDAL